jgi:hypothetical protein
MKALCLGIGSAVVCLAMFASQAAGEEKGRLEGGIPQSVLNGLIASDRLPSPTLPRIGTDPLPMPPSVNGTEKKTGPAPQANANATRDKTQPKDKVLPPVPANVLEKWLQNKLAALKNHIIPPGLLKEKLTGKPDNPGKSQGKGKGK